MDVLLCTVYVMMYAWVDVCTCVGMYVCLLCVMHVCMSGRLNMYSVYVMMYAWVCV